MYLEVTADRLWLLMAVVLPLSSIAAGIPASTSGDLEARLHVLPLFYCAF